MANRFVFFVGVVLHLCLPALAKPPQAVQDFLIDNCLDCHDGAEADDPKSEIKQRRHGPIHYPRAGEAAQSVIAVEPCGA